MREVGVGWGRGGGEDEIEASVTDIGRLLYLGVYKRDNGEEERAEWKKQERRGLTRPILTNGKSERVRLPSMYIKKQYLVEAGAWA